jgi:hypothetical protein
MTLAEMLFKPRGVPLFQHLRHASQTSGRLLGQALLTLMFLPFDAVVSLDATMRTIGRLMFTRRNLLEWRTASEAEKSTGTDLKSYWITMWCAPAMAVLLGFGLFFQPSPAWPVALPILGLWLCAPLAAWWISLPIEGRQLALSAQQKRALRLVARKPGVISRRSSAPKIIGCPRTTTRSIPSRCWRPARRPPTLAWA